MLRFRLEQIRTGLETVSDAWKGEGAKVESSFRTIDITRYLAVRYQNYGLAPVVEENLSP